MLKCLKHIKFQEMSKYVIITFIHLRLPFIYFFYLSCFVDNLFPFLWINEKHLDVNLTFKTILKL